MRSEPNIFKVLPTPNSEEAELYFIQYWFCVNRDILRAAFRELYDEFFKVYLRIYEEGRAAHMDLKAIDDKFEMTFTEGLPHNHKKK